MKFLRHWREQAGFTQEGLAQAVEVATRTVNRWENDIREPRATDIKKLCEVLKVSEAELLNGPQSKEISVKLRLGKVEEMNKMTLDVRNNRFDLIMEGGALGIAGIAEFEDDDAFESALAKICEELRDGWEFIKNRKKSK